LNDLVVFNTFVGLKTVAVAAIPVTSGLL